MINKTLTKKILNTLLKTGGSFAEIFAQKKEANNIKLEDGKIENSSSGFELGCGLRLIYEDSTFYAYVDSLQQDILLNAAQILSSAVNKTSKNKVLNLNKVYNSYTAPIKRHPSDINQDKKKEILLNVDSFARNYSHFIIQVSSNLSDMEEEIYIANSEGIICHDNSTKTMLSVNVVAQQKKEIRTGYKSLARTSGYEVFDIKSPAIVSGEAARIAVKMLEAVNTPSGTQQVVIGPAFGGVIFHEACGHGLEADAILKDASVFKDKTGRKIANSIVTAIDNPAMPYHWGSYAFDGEGFPSQENILIKDGVLKNYIFDYKTAKKMNKKQTSNGRRQSYRDIPIPRMSNTYLARGSEDPGNILKSVKKGIYAKEFSGGQVDPAIGDFVFGISEGYIIENGEIANPIKGATLIGNGPEILNKIEAIGNDLDFAPGFCLD
ncbi:MAG: TldD/PmbA family protein [Actinobacteria bacterium]|nr:TldD/PmbA family protein [Actinomycetota bacterium]